MNIEQIVANCVQAMRSGENAIAVIDAAIFQYPGLASLYFLRASEHAEAEAFQLALHDFATALVLEPEFNLARLQYIFCSISLQQTGVLPVLLQPLMQLEECALKYYAKALVAVLNNNAVERDVMLESSARYDDAIAAIESNIRQLGLDESIATLSSSTEIEQNGVISSILLEVYKRSH